MSAPPAAVTRTTIHGGMRQTANIAKATSASAASIGLKIDVVITGVYSAASSTPTTAAFTPRSVAWTVGRERSSPHVPSATNEMKNVGRKIATYSNSPPAQPFVGGIIPAPINAVPITRVPEQGSDPEH